MSEDDLSRACAMVGRFLHEFALVEQEINNRIANILDLKGGAVDAVAHSIDFLKKANLLRTVAIEPQHYGLIDMRHAHFMFNEMSEPVIGFGVRRHRL